MSALIWYFAGLVTGLVVGIGGCIIFAAYSAGAKWAAESEKEFGTWGKR